MKAQCTVVSHEITFPCGSSHLAIKEENSTNISGDQKGLCDKIDHVYMIKNADDFKTMNKEDFLNSRKGCLSRTDSSTVVNERLGHTPT